MKSIKFRINRTQFETFCKIVVDINNRINHSQYGMYDIEKINLYNFKFYLLNQIPKWSLRNQYKYYNVSIDINMFYFFRTAFEKVSNQYGEYERNLIYTFTNEFHSEITNAMPKLYLKNTLN